MREYGNSMRIPKGLLMSKSKLEMLDFMGSVKNTLIKDLKTCIVLNNLKNPDIYLMHKIDTTTGDMLFAWYIGDALTLSKRVEKEQWVIDSYINQKSKIGGL